MLKCCGDTTLLGAFMLPGDGPLSPGKPRLKLPVSAPLGCGCGAFRCDKPASVYGVARDDLHGQWRSHPSNLALSLVRRLLWIRRQVSALREQAAAIHI